MVENPLVLGHESSGVVAACGQNVKDLKVGDHIAIEPGIACNTCKYCRGGRYNLCGSMGFAATPPHDGTLSTYYRVPAECCYKLPPHVSLRDGALVEPLSVAVHSCRLAGDMQDKDVIIFGAGPVGLLCCSVARAFGASKVAVVDVVASRLESAKNYGATHIYQMNSRDTQDGAGELLSLVGSKEGVSIVLDASGAEKCINWGIETLESGGLFIQVGLGQPNVSFPVGQVCDKEIIFKGSFRYGPGDYRLAIGLLSSQRVSLEGLVTHEFPFSQAENAFKNVLGRNGIKTVIYGPDVDDTLARAV